MEYILVAYIYNTLTNEGYESTRPQKDLIECNSRLNYAINHYKEQYPYNIKWKCEKN